ncbi:MAG: energy transducer TonB [Flavobacteriaceae bacterium]
MKKILTAIFVLVFSVGFSQIKTDSIYIGVDTFAEYKTGTEGFFKFVKDNFAFPAGFNEDISGNVILSFVVETSGELSAITVMRSLHPMLDSVVVDLVKQTSGNWFPATIAGQKVRSRQTVPVRISVTPEPEPVVAFDQQATYPEGMEMLEKRFMANFKPSHRIKQDKEALIILSFVVEPDGSLSDIQAEKHFGSDSGEKAIEALQKSGNWSPALYKGNPVRSVVTLPIKINQKGVWNRTVNNARWN